MECEQLNVDKDVLGTTDLQSVALLTTTDLNSVLSMFLTHCTGPQFVELGWMECEQLNVDKSVLLVGALSNHFANISPTFNGISKQRTTRRSTRRRPLLRLRRV